MNMTKQPQKNCNLCPNLVAFRMNNQKLYTDFFNAPVPCFGNQDANLMIVGLAPGLKGANQTGRPFTKDFAGILLYDTLSEFGLSKGKYDERADDGLELTGARIVNAVRCVPPENKVTTSEIKTCNQFLISEIENMKKLKVIVTLGTVAHNAVLLALGQKLKDYKFAHGAVHKIGDLILVNSYHCSKYNTSTRRLTSEMFKDVFKLAKSLI